MRDRIRQIGFGVATGVVASIVTAFALRLVEHADGTVWWATVSGVGIVAFAVAWFSLGTRPSERSAVPASGITVASHLDEPETVTIEHATIAPEPGQPTTVASHIRRAGTVSLSDVNIGPQAGSHEKQRASID